MSESEQQAQKEGLGERLRNLRLGCGLSMRQLAREAGVTYSYISGVESGKVSPTIAMLRKILVAMDTGLGAFFTDEANGTEGNVFRRKDMRAAEERTRRYVFMLPRRRDMHIELTEESVFPGDTEDFETLSSDISGTVVEGELLLELHGAEPQILLPGDGFHVPAGRPLRGRSASAEKPVRLVCAYFPPRY